MVRRFLTPTRRYTHGKYEHEDTLVDAEPSTCAGDPKCEITRSPLDLPLHKPSCIDNEYTDQTKNPKVRLDHGRSSKPLIPCVAGP